MIINTISLIGTITGLLLTFLVFFKKTGLGVNKKLKYTLSFLIFIFSYTCLDYFLYSTVGEDNVYVGGSYLLYHLIGFILYYFISQFLNNRLLIKKWFIYIIVYSIFKIVFLLYFFQYNSINEFLIKENYYNFLYWVSWEYFWASLINIYLSFSAYKAFIKTPLTIDLTPEKRTQFKWIKIIILSTIIFQIIMFINNMIALYDEQYFDFHIKLDTTILAMFFFLFAYSIMHFPVFAFTGNFKDLPKNIQKKYAKSSLTDATGLFNEIEKLVTSEKLYLEFDLKLNTIAEKLNKSIHHISQAINQTANMSFTDYINAHRIEAAKTKLLANKPDTIYAISLDVGFNSKAAFYAAFKKSTNKTPSQFKKENKI
ncbi:helix-turn-helix domain-containing protein [Tenacibaculum holothuriorum]|nr:helix-turn-helix domain-containing protein [Tenacibaculum holothuriorum]